jgi:hypothetical protein
MSLNSSGSGAVVHGEDVYRKADNSDCLMFNEFFAAAAILVSIVYYAVVKLSLMAMGAVVMLPPVPHPSYQGSEDDEDGDGEESVEAEHEVVRHDLVEAEQLVADQVDVVDQWQSHFDQTIIDQRDLS